MLKSVKQQRELLEPRVSPKWPLCITKKISYLLDFWATNQTALGVVNGNFYLASKNAGVTVVILGHHTQLGQDLNSYALLEGGEGEGGGEDGLGTSAA